MSDDPIIPRPDEAIGAGVERLVALRPAAQGFIDSGRYGSVLAGWRAELALVIQRLVREVEASRLETAVGEALRDLCASEFDTTLPVGPLTALGDVRLVRGPGGPAGVIRAGTRFRRSAKPSDPLLPRTEASFTAALDVVVPQGQTGAAVSLVAIRAGAFANTPVGIDTNGNMVGAVDIQSADALFDPNFQVSYASSAGGSDGATDDILKTAASAYAVGRYAPTVGAVIAAALLAGAVHVAVLEDPVWAVSNVLAQDVSWASTGSWLNQIQTAADGQGFGCRANVTGALSTFVKVAASATLRDKSALVSSGAILQAITAAVTSYFNDRPDWYTWRAAGLRIAITRAHPSIKACTFVSVADASTGAVLTEPPAVPQMGSAVHWMLAPGAVQTTLLV